MYSLYDHFCDKYIRKNSKKEVLQNNSTTIKVLTDYDNFRSSSTERLLSHYLSKEDLKFRDKLIDILNQIYQKSLAQLYKNKKRILNINSLEYQDFEYTHSIKLHSFLLNIFDILKTSFIKKSTWRSLLYKYLYKQDIKTVIGISAIRNFILQNKLLLSYTTIFNTNKSVTTYDQYICCLNNDKLQLSSTRYPRIYYHYSELYNNQLRNVKTNEN